MSDYDTLKKILNNGYAKYVNPIELEENEYKERWRKDWETDYLLLCTSNDFLFIFDNSGNFKYVINSY